MIHYTTFSMIQCIRAGFWTYDLSECFFQCCIKGKFGFALLNENKLSANGAKPFYRTMSVHAMYVTIEKLYYTRVQA